MVVKNAEPDGCWVTRSPQRIFGVHEQVIDVFGLKILNPIDVLAMWLGLEWVRSPACLRHADIIMDLGQDNPHK